jgi:hypothetical protein
LPDQTWEKVIAEAIKKCNVVFVCLSNKSISRAGYVQKEIGYALDIALMHPEDAIFIVPVKLEECEVPDRLNRWQSVNLFEDKGYKKLMESLKRVCGCISEHTKSPSDSSNEIISQDLKLYKGYINDATLNCKKKLKQLLFEHIIRYISQMESNWPQDSKTFFDFYKVGLIQLLFNKEQARETIFKQTAFYLKVKREELTDQLDMIMTTHIAEFRNEIINRVPDLLEDYFVNGFISPLSMIIMRLFSIYPILSVSWLFQPKLALHAVFETEEQLLRRFGEILHKELRRIAFDYRSEIKEQIDKEFDRIAIVLGASIEARIRNEAMLIQTSRQ